MNENNRYEILVSADTEEWAMKAFRGAFDKDRHVEKYDIHQYDEVTFGVFFWTVEPLILENHPLVMSVEELEEAH
jgi:hypothetical protein